MRYAPTDGNSHPEREIPSRGRVCVAREGCGRAGIPTEGCETVNASYDYFVNLQRHIFRFCLTGLAGSGGNARKR